MNTTDHIRIVKSVCNKYWHRLRSKSEMDEIFSVGLLALVRCLPTHNPEMGTLDKYIMVCVKRDIVRYLRKNIAGIFNIPVGTRVDRTHESFDKIIESHHSYETKYFDDDIDSKLMKIRRLIGSRDFKILMMHYNDDMSMNEIIEKMKLNMTRQGLHYIINRAKEKIREAFSRHPSA